VIICDEMEQSCFPFLSSSSAVMISELPSCRFQNLRQTINSHDSASYESFQEMRVLAA
jgi:hypothetical protein